MRIERRSYSRSPWRLITADGKEQYIRQVIDHPILGPTVIDGPVCGATKAECIENALALLGTLMKNRRNENEKSDA